MGYQTVYNNFQKLFVANSGEKDDRKNNKMLEYVDKKFQMLKVCK